MLNLDTSAAVTRLHHSALPQIEALCSEIGAVIYRIDGRGLTDKDALIARINTALPIGEGLTPRSWDGLSDGLWSGFDALPNQPARIVILWMDAQDLINANPADFAMMQRVMMDLTSQVATTVNGFSYNSQLRWILFGSTAEFPPLSV